MCTHGPDVLSLGPEVATPPIPHARNRRDSAVTCQYRSYFWGSTSALDWPLHLQSCPLSTPGPATECSLRGQTGRMHCSAKNRWSRHSTPQKVRIWDKGTGPGARRHRGRTPAGSGPQPALLSLSSLSLKRKIMLLWNSLVYRQSQMARTGNPVNCKV